MKIELLSFETNTGTADFEVSVGREELVTCHATVCLEDFMNGEAIIDPYQWYDMNEDAIDKPEWFKRNDLFKMNHVFEENFKKFL